MRKKLELNGVKVLLVEDDNFLSEILKVSLAAQGSELFVAEHAKEALALARSKHPDIIFTDLMLSGMSGEELIEAVKSDAELKDIPVVVFSNKGSEDDVSANLARGAAEYHVKSSTNLKDIPKIIHRVIENTTKTKK